MTLQLVAVIHGPEDLPSIAPVGPVQASMATFTRRALEWLHSLVFSVKDHYAPPAITLSYVLHRRRRHFGPPQYAAQQHGDDGVVEKSLRRRNVRRSTLFPVLNKRNLPHVEDKR